MSVRKVWDAISELDKTLSEVRLKQSEEGQVQSRIEEKSLQQETIRRTSARWGETKTTGVAAASFQKFDLEKWAQPPGDLNFQRAL